LLIFLCGGKESKCPRTGATLIDHQENKERPTPQAHRNKRRAGKQIKESPMPQAYRRNKRQAGNPIKKWPTPQATNPSRREGQKPP
jgi:hypothetical protein